MFRLPKPIRIGRESQFKPSRIEYMPCSLCSYLKRNEKFHIFKYKRNKIHLVKNIYIYNIYI